MAPDLAVRVAETPSEREAVHRSRYSIYVEEMGRYRSVADHERRLLVDPEDEHSWIIYVAAGDEVVASTRLTWGGAGFSARQTEQYHLAPFLAELPAERLVVGERTMISPHWRGIDLFSLIDPVCRALTEAHDVRVVFGACEPHLISFYAHHQRPFGTRNVNSAEAGFLIPLVSFPDGPESLAEFGPDGALPRCVQDVLTGTGTVVSPVFAGDQVYEALALGEIAALGSSVFDGLTDDEVRHCLRRSNVIRCADGDRLLKTGGAARNMFVVLSGSLSVSRDGSPVNTIGPGEVAGEMAYLLHQPRSFDVDVVGDGTTVLSLSERTLRRLPDEDPVAAAKLADNVARQLCRRLTAEPPAPADQPSTAAIASAGDADPDATARMASV